MKFEFHEAKSRSNKKEHGIDFVEAQSLWLDDSHVQAPAHNRGEERFLVIGMIGGKHWTAVITYRGDAIRPISCRRARKKEVRQYEENQR